MSFQDDEASAEDNRPIELYQISTPVKSYLFASGNRDWSTNSTVWKAIPIARTELVQASPGKQQDVSISLPVNHELIGRYLELGAPPRYIDVVIWRQQVRSLEIERIWGGKVSSLAIEDRVAKLRIPARATEMMLRMLPQITRGKMCPHILYDQMCSTGNTTIRTLNKVTTTVIYVSGREVRVDLGPGLSHVGFWSEGGELVHTSSTERRTIGKQSDFSPFSSITVVTMQMPIPGLRNGDTVEVYAGCDHTIDTCYGKFGNQRNFGGFPNMNTKNSINYVWHIKDND